jgi:phosphoribosylformimino-5-aminoimidazole carboxamide ribotide isomerase
MILFPAIDLKDGRCVRLHQGRMDSATIFDDDPGARALSFQTSGFQWVHVVDLDGATEGAPKNAGAVSAILNQVKIPVQIGGGIRSMGQVEFWLTAGATRVILGTAAARDPAFTKAAAKAFPGRVAIGIDARDGKVAVQGWTETTDTTAVELAQRYEDAGAACLIVTDIGRDGMKTGANLDLIGAVADAVATPVIVSGGVKSVEDIRASRARQGKNPLYGIILGRALYDGDIEPAEALRMAAA